MCFRALLIKSCGPKPKGNNLNLYDEFLDFYNDEYKKLGYVATHFYAIMLIFYYINNFVNVLFIYWII